MAVKLFVLLSALCFATLPLCEASGVMRRVDRQAPKESLFPSILSHMLTNVPAQRLFAVENIVLPTYEAFPKNAMGRVPMQAIHSIVRSYLAAEHGWLIKGFEFTSTKSTELQESLLLQNRAPEFVSALRELQSSDIGLSLGDVVATVAAVEHLILEESILLVKGAYSLNNQSLATNLPEKTVEELLSSYLLLLRQGVDRNNTDFHRHNVYMAHAKQHVQDWDNLLQFERSVLKDIGHSGPYSFEVVSQIVREMTRRYGKWQNSECTEIKTKLLELEMQADQVDTGRVPFKSFQAEPMHPHYAFTESSEQLAQMGALDEGKDGTLNVLVANYLAASSNCIASSRFVSVCCLSECDSLMASLEASVQASEVPLHKLLSVVSDISSSTMETPRKLGADLIEKARGMAQRHRGFVPLHSGDFKQWFHFAFPNECPYPTALEMAAEDYEGQVADQWLGKGRVPAWQVAADGELIRV